MEFVHAKRTVVTDYDITEVEEKAIKKSKEETKNSKDAPLTKSELRNVLKAMDTDGFNNIMDEYIKEISDPNNVKEQNQFLLESEKRKDLPANVKLAQPNIGFCFKTEKKHLSKPNTREKIFINVCTLKEVPEPEEQKDSNGRGSQWSLPYLVNKPRNDMDSKNRHCQTFDVIFNPKAIEMAKKFSVFKKFVCDNAVNGINLHFLAPNKEEASLDYSLIKKYDYKGNEVSLINIHGLSSGKYDNKREPLNEFKNSMMKEIEAQKNEIPLNDEKEFDQVDVKETELRNLNKLEEKTEIKNMVTKDDNFNTLVPEYKIKYSDNFSLQSHFYDPTSNNSLDSKETTMIIELKLSKIDDTINLLSIAELDFKDKKLRLKVENYYDCLIELKSNLIEETITANWDKQKRLLTVKGIVLKVIFKNPISDTNSDEKFENQNNTNNNESNQLLNEIDNIKQVNEKCTLNENNTIEAKNELEKLKDEKITQVESTSSLINNNKLSEVLEMMNKINQDKINKLENSKIENFNEKESSNKENLKKELSKEEQDLGYNCKAENQHMISEIENTKTNDITQEQQSCNKIVENHIEELNDNDDTENNFRNDNFIIQKISIIEFQNPLIFEIV
jgi:hypothetical protein